MQHPVGEPNPLCHEPVFGLHAATPGSGIDSDGWSKGWTRMMVATPMHGAAPMLRPRSSWCTTPPSCATSSCSSTTCEFFACLPAYVYTCFLVLVTYITSVLRSVWTTRELLFVSVGCGDGPWVRDCVLLHPGLSQQGWCGLARPRRCAGIAQLVLQAEHSIHLPRAGCMPLHHQLV